MAYIAGLLAVLFLCSLIYTGILQIQMRRISRILHSREKDQGSQLASLDMINKDLNELAQSINTCLQAEEKLRLKAVAEEKQYKELIANISHDLRTPLTVIKGYQQLIHNESDNLSQDQKQKLQIAMKSTDELGTLINHFFEYSYLVNHEPEIKKERLNLTNLVSDCLAESFGMLEDKGIGIEFSISTAYHVIADRECMTRVIQNLIRNVCQHASGEVKVDMIHQKDIVELSFKNKVSADFTIDPQHLFDRFYTGEGKKATTTGLGLAIVKILTEKMDGRAYAEVSDDKSRLRISICLPAA